MNIAMLPLGSISQSAPTGKNNAQAGDLKNAFSTILQTQYSKTTPNENDTVENLADVLKEILQILKEGLPNSNGLEFTNSKTISDEQMSGLLGMTKEDWKKQLDDLMVSLQSLFANFPPFTAQLKEVNLSLKDNNLLQGMSEFVAAFSKLPAELLQQLKGNQLQTFAQNVKAAETIAKTIDLSMGDIKQLTRLKDGLQNIISKMEELVKNSKLSTQNSIQDNSFSSLLKDQQSIGFRLKDVNFSGQLNQSKVLTENSEQQSTDSAVQPSLVANIMNPASKLEQFVIHVGKENATANLNYNEFVKELSNILAKSQLTTGLNGSNKLFIKLYPEHLGSIRIELLQDKGMITAKMFASNGNAKDLLDSGIHQLKEAFTMQNIQVDKIDVIYGQNEAQKFSQQDAKQQSANQQNSEKQKQEADEENESQFSNLLNESILEKIV
ncbi:flagellar hook-length control protein FliK [Bacillus sp. FJAT-49736]|uniref:flagellar hook-length control protein FliK n=1 Tax=Bacillus sp. FJAT-49736 TaxID=2833582 RepID=UPI001BCA5008|nr:flagellar hook-length control protein FliK [Bacillus sp. FJAT-49736]MBS4172520.1 flagellar hook-length control protein FliK [Bacillus sp. FJAT-49736]